MKRSLILMMLSVSWLGLSAQTPTVAQPSSTGVSDAFRNYAKTNAAKLAKSLKTGVAGTQEVGIQAEDADVEVPNHFYIPRGGGESVGLASKASLAKAEALTLSVTTAPSSMYTQTTNGTLPVTKVTDYVGLGNGFAGWTLQGLLPPDTTMAVGNNQIVQWVNIRLTVLNKTTGAPLLPSPGYVTGNQIWSGLGSTSLCKNFNRGDPVLQYDRMAGRWLLSQFAFNGTSASSSFAMCFAVSQTSDATGAYNLYEYSNNPYLPDYPKLGVWTDAYYWTANDFDFRTNSAGSFAGTRDCALDRAAMLAGNPATMICFAGLGATTGEYFASLPADFEGSIAPPAGSSEYILNVDWFSKNNPPYVMELRRFHPDFVTPANSTLDDGFGGGPGSFVAMPFANNVVGACGDGGGACVTQPGTTRRLDTLAMRPMYRLAYRNMGLNRESLVFTETVDPTGSAVAGIQMVEIRNPGANPPVVYNNVNFNPDTTNRWMGAAATDKVGNILLGYSVSSTAKAPSIRIAGRQRNDIKNTLRGEIEVKAGAGNQTSSSSRWGDYSTMQIDPDDDCTFWYTQEYTNVSSSANWATHIVGYKFNNCN
jgi:hypothetical protein